MLLCRGLNINMEIKIVVACRHQAQAHRLARARRNNSRLAIGNYEMNAAIVGGAAGARTKQFNDN